MEIKETERIVIAKPIASRPTCSKFRSFSDLLAGAINAPSPNVCLETAVTAIRPKTVRFRPVANCAPVALVSLQAELSRRAVSNSSERVTKSDTKPAVIYKPQAKLVSKTTASLLANMGNFMTNQQQSVALVNARVRHSKQEQCKFASHHPSKVHQNIACSTETDHAAELSSLLSSQKQEKDPKSLPPATSGDRLSYDGYNWRKYGQKQVKGSEYPRSYYKCTHPNCPVKKKVERSFDGQIAEIVYKGEHNHSKPLPPKRSTGTQGLELVADVPGQDASTRLWVNRQNERNEGSEDRVENQNAMRLPTYSTHHGKAPQRSYSPVGAVASDNSCGLSGECDKGMSKVLERDDDDEPRSKRRKSENQSNETGISREGAQEPRVVGLNSTDSEIFRDGFRWRKYGQKIVKGNPYPRSYYRCTSLKCNVRKYVERASDDSETFVTTYEGKHNHEMPSRSTNPAASETNSQAP